MANKFDEARARRRAHRQERIYSQLRDVMEETFDKAAWNMNRNPEDGSTRRIQGHPGVAGSAFVTEVLSDFDLGGHLRCRYLGLTREAGMGGHGIIDGVLKIEATITPPRGAPQRFEVPVQVRAGKMLRPALLKYQGHPVVISQSGIDDIVQPTTFDDPPELDREHMFAPKRKRAKFDPASFMTREEQEKLKQQREDEKATEKSEADKAKARRKQNQGVPQDFDLDRVADGSTKVARLNTELQVGADVICQGAYVQIIASYDDGIHVVDSNGVEALVDSSFLVRAPVTRAITAKDSDPIWVKLTAPSAPSPSSLEQPDDEEAEENWDDYDFNAEPLGGTGVTLGELEKIVTQNTTNLRSIYELEYKVSMLSRERKKGPLADRAEMNLMQWRTSLEAAVNSEISLLHDAFIDWMDESNEKYGGMGDTRIIQSIQGMTDRLASPPAEIGPRIALLHEALTTAHHNASMGTFAYGKGRDNDSAMEGEIQNQLDDLSNTDVSPWDAELEKLKSMPRGGAKR